MPDPTPNPAPDDSPEQPRSGGFMKIIRILFSNLLPLTVLAAGIIIAVTLMRTKPIAERRPPQRQARLVETVTVNPSTQRIVIPAMGRVSAALRVPLRPRVTGEVVELSPDFIPGGVFAAGDVILKVDPTDYEIARLQRRAEVARAQSNLRLEEGANTSPGKTLNSWGESVSEEDAEFVLRQPQLESAQAQLKVAQAQLEDAELNLRRTIIRAPFNALALSRNANPGTLVNPNTTLTELAGVDEFWVELEVPVDALQWIDIPKTTNDLGSTVQLFDEAAWGEGVAREARVLRLTGEVDNRSRMATVLVSIKDPLSLLSENRGQPELLLNSYVRAEILGRNLEDVISLKREHLHENDTIWTINAEGRLEIDPVDVVYRGPEDILVRIPEINSLSVITTNLTTPVEGMAPAHRRRRASRLPA
jgi:RND family efflux transporter MFP subunit